MLAPSVDKQNYQETISKHNKSSQLHNNQNINMEANNLIHNLSQYTLNEQEESILSKGLTFIPTPTGISLPLLQKDHNNFIRNIKLKYYFHYHDNKSQKPMTKFTQKSTWNPKSSSLPQECHDLISQLDNTFKAQSINSTLNTDLQNNQNRINNKDNNNISLSEREAIKSLKNNEHIIIKPADKGGAIIVMDKHLYREECYRQLQDTRYYKHIEHPLQPQTTKTIQKLTNELLKAGYITCKQHQHLSPPPKPRPRHFYILPKIHKPTHTWPNSHMPPGRPIISNCSSETSNISKYIDYFLKPLTTKHPSYIKNSLDLISKIRDKIINPTDLLVTFDVSSLYTNMHLQRIMDIVRKTFEEFPDPKRPTHTLLQLLNVILHNNDFTFDNQTYLQTTGVAMGLGAAPSLADMYMTHFDHIAMTGFHILPKYYFRYLDDIFLIFPGSVEDLNQYSNFLNKIIPGIKLEVQYNQDKINFLDLTIYRHISGNQNTLQTYTYFKDTDTHTLLHRQSYHPSHTFNSIITSQVLRFKRNSSFKIHFDYSCNVLFSFLKKRDYNYRTLKKIKNQVWFSQKILPETN